MMYEALRRQIPLQFMVHANDPNLFVVRMVSPADSNQAYIIGLMQQDGDRWHSVDEEDGHLESSLMLDVAYGLLAKRITEQDDETADWISENYPLADYSFLFERPQNKSEVRLTIAAHDFDRLATSYSRWIGMGGQEGRFERMVDGDAILGHPEGDWEHVYWLRDAWADVLLAGAFLDAQSAPYELWWDMGGLNEPCYMILTNWASPRHKEMWRKSDEGKAVQGT